MDTETKKKLKRCANCGYGPLREESITDRFEYWDDGDEPITIEASGVPVEVCPNCGERYFGPASVRVKHAAVCRTLGLLTPEEIQAIRERFGPTQSEFAKLTGIGEATISRWERGRMLPNRAMDHYLRLLDRNPANVQILHALGTRPLEDARFPGLERTPELVAAEQRFCQHRGAVTVCNPSAPTAPPSTLAESTTEGN